ncbi:MAG: metalloregulator ArsR/SmtB family transcription factor [Pseudomonadota bacterium]
MNKHLLPPDLVAMQDHAEDAARFIKSLSHSGRLRILCYLHEGERSVGELEDMLGARQAAVSQHLARLRSEGLVTTRRDGKTVYYRLADERAKRLLATLYEIFCAKT